MEYPFESVGKILAGKALPAKFTKSKPWWMILSCDEGIMYHYRWQLHSSGDPALQTQRICNPIAKCHISIVRGEAPKISGLWDALVGRKVSFRYSPEVRTNGKHWWLPIECPEIESIRAELGLPTSKVPLHLTIGTNADS